MGDLLLQGKQRAWRVLLAVLFAVCVAAATYHYHFRETRGEMYDIRYLV